MMIYENSFGQFDEKFYFPSKEIQISDSLTFESYFFKIDNDSLNYIVFNPQNNQIKTTCIYFHGAGGNYSNYINLIKPIIKCGIQVIMVDFRGYGNSSGKPTHLNIKADGEKLLSFLLDKFKMNKIILYGASMGTQIATYLAQKYQDEITALVLDGTISSFTDIALVSAPLAQKSMIQQYVTAPYSAKEDIQLIQPNNMKILIIHSEQDSEIPIAMGKEVFQNAPIPKDLWIYSGEHLEAPLKETKLFMEKIKLLIQ
ncbi:MAG: alpha/beta fold hydrolase [Flavobacteriia bacterium]|nr:alpha/beta fold hydrolase [Flavobacteriia bacterium]